MREPLRYPNLRFKTFECETPRGMAEIAKMIDNIEATIGERFREIVRGNNHVPVTCMVSDGIYSSMAEKARQEGIPTVHFMTMSPSCIWTYLCLPKLLESGELPFEGEDLDVPITSVPGFDGVLRRRDLPSFCRNINLQDNYVQIVQRVSQQYPRAQGHILNTFDALEGSLLSPFRASCPNLYTIGPLHLHSRTRLEHDTAEKSFSSNIMWQEDRSCIAWLDKQQPKSVVYVSMGTLALVTRDQLLEFWHGLVNSDVAFLWVWREGSIVGLDSHDQSQLQAPQELLDSTKQRGCIVSWVPQEEVLSHPATGAFLTHSGWNSTLESIAEGVPMICWAFFVDQQVNSRLVDKVWKIGIDIKDTCDRTVIETMVRDVMDRKKDEFLQNANRLAVFAREAVSKGGSSYCALSRLVEDIKSMRL